jgi:hypothetical protein
MDPVVIQVESLSKILADPQSLNSYVYSRNNPVILVDADGNIWRIFTDLMSHPAVGFASKVGQTTAGVAVGAVNEVGNIASSIIHPIRTLNETSELIQSGYEGGKELAKDYLNNPDQTVNEIKQGLSISTNEWMNKSSYEQGKDLGKTGLDVYLMGKAIDTKPVMSKGMPALQIGDTTVGLNNNPILRAGKGYLEKGAKEKQFRVSFGNKDSFIHGHIHANNILNPSKWVQKIFNKKNYD